MQITSWPQKSLRCWRLVPWCVALAVPFLAAQAAEPSWPDIESRIQYGYFTEDARSLRALLQPLSVADSDGGLKGYYAGLLSYRLSELAQAGQSSAAGKLPAAGARAPDKDEARRMIERCVDSLDSVLARQRDFADALALQSACLSRLAELGSWRAPLAAQKSTTQLRKALQVEPQNPRVLLLEAVHDYQHAQRPSGDTTEQACGKFSRTAAAFEAERAQVDKVPGWGAAEAYTWLGRCYLDRDEPLRARDALERALLIAPDFGQARRLLTTLTSG